MSLFVVAFILGYLIPVVALVSSIVFFFQGEVAPAVSLFMFWLLVSRAKSDEDES